MEKLLRGSDMIIVSPSQSSSNGHVQTDRCVRQTCVIHEASQEWKGARRQTQTLMEAPHRIQEASSTASSQEHLDYVVLVATANVLDLSDDCLRRMLLFSECKRAFLAIACVCSQFRKLVTRAVIDEWSLSAFGLQDASRSLASACKVMRLERQANVEKRSHVFLPPNSRLAYFWASDGTYYSGTVLSLNLRAKVLQSYAI